MLPAATCSTPSSNAWLEVQWYMFAGMVMLGAPYTLKVNEHVRVDLVYGMVSRTRARSGSICSAASSVPAADLRHPDLFHLAVVRRCLADPARASTNAGGLCAGRSSSLLPVGFGADGAAGHLRNHQVHRGARSTDYQSRVRLREAAAMIDFVTHNMAPLMFAGLIVVHADRLSGGVLARGGRPVLRLHRHRARPDPRRLSRQPDLSAFRHRLERSAARDSVLHADGGDPRAMRARRRPARFDSASCSDRCAAGCPMR